ncbi:MAG: dipeptidase, partial [Armatimonadota bacterium]
MNREQLIEWIETHTGEMIADFQRLLRAESVRSDPEPHAPFGKGVREALDIVLEMGEQFELRPRDFDGYACDLEIGAGSEMVASLSHIDVVPAGKGWTKPPFGA